MEVIKTKIEDLCILEPTVYGDERGYFFESYTKRVFDDLVEKEYNFVQDNESRSSYGVLRGLHYQLAPYSQAKLVRVLQGRVYDVAVDLRKDSPTYGEWEGVELSYENKKQLLVPKGFAHGFCVLSEIATFVYKCDEYYNPKVERGIVYNDPTLDIDWKVKDEDISVSDKDGVLPELADAEVNF
ncbi:MAG: dTDP-4-dehydrorhamnose 3,5-epimerase [Methanosarcinaceae archaeon]|nr:dTDP-4-dehydrorhamnose 3,5-epimerase [Methanosarcinaceae archaeon]